MTQAWLIDQNLLTICVHEHFHVDMQFNRAPLAGTEEFWTTVGLVSYLATSAVVVHVPRRDGQHERGESPLPASAAPRKEGGAALPAAAAS